MIENIADYLPILFGLLAAAALGVAVLIPALRDPMVAVLVLIVSLPFERVPSIELAGLTLRFNQLAALILIASIALSLLFDRRHLRPVPMFLPVVAFLVVTMWTTPAALNVARAVSVFAFVALMTATAAAIPQAVSDTARLRPLATTLVVLSAGLSLFGLFQFFGEMIGLPESLTFIKEGYGREVFGFPRVHAFSHEPLYFANFLFIPLGVMAGLLVNRVEVLPRRWLVASLALTLVAFLLSLSRGAFIAAVPFGLVVAVLFFRRLLSPATMIAGVFAVGVAVTAVWGILGIVSPEARERFIGHATLQDVLVERRGESGFGRLATFERAVGVWRSAPLWGVGLGNYGPAVAADPLVRPDAGWDIVNNQYLESLAETGVVGLLLLLLFWGWVVVRSFVAYARAREPLLRALLGGLTAAFVAILVQYNFFSTLYIMHIWVVIGLLVALQNIALFGERRS